MQQPAFGDVVYVKRKIGYEHYGVCVGGNRIIHYVGDKINAPFPHKIIIGETSFSEFLDGDTEWGICLFDERGQKKLENEMSSLLLKAFGGVVVGYISPLARILLLFLGEFYTLYKAVSAAHEFLFKDSGHILTPAETVRNARSHLNETGYNVLTHNCEHFAIECKTGVKDSEQVRNVVDVIASGLLVLVGNAIISGKNNA